MPSKPKPTTTAHGGARAGAGRKTDEERGGDHYQRYSAARAKREEHNAALAEMEEAKVRGTLVDRAEVAQSWAGLVSNARAKLLALPTKLAPSLVGMEAVYEVEAALMASVREALSELAEYDGGVARR